MEFQRDIFERATIEEVWDGIQETVLSQVPDDLSIPHPDEMVRTVLHIAGLLNQGENGGLVQFIDNWDGGNFHETKDAAMRIGCPELADILGRIAALYPGRQVPKEWTQRRELWDRMCEERFLPDADRRLSEQEWEELWSGFDREFYDIVPGIKQKAVEYVRINAEIKC